MKIAVFCDSVTGNTNKLAKCICNACKDHEVYFFKDFDLEMVDSDIVFLGSFVKDMEPSEKFKKVFRLIIDKNVFIYGTCSFDDGPDYYDRIYKNFLKYVPASNNILGYFFCNGKLPYSYRMNYEARLMRDRSDILAKKKLENFDRVLKHPSPSDFKELEFKIKMILESGIVCL